LAPGGVVAERVTAAVELLEQGGPALGRPLVDTLKGSRHPNMKELRSHSGQAIIADRLDVTQENIS
jgi:hypothetical protein